MNVLPTMTRHRIPLPNDPCQRGFTLVEALVALVVLSIGMLGIAALYVESLRAGREAVTRSTAVLLAGDMADRIRANRDAGPAYAKDADDVGAESANCEQGGASASCTPAVMAAHDIALWEAEIKQTLPGGSQATGEIAVNTGTNPRTYTITVSWIEVGQTNPVSYVVRIQT